LDLDSLAVVAGARVICAGMVAKLAVTKPEQNAVVLKVIEKEDAIRRSSEQLQSKC
jgi:1-aminocyclopropane-1-carboxylate deaminase/D-cysteine desulfhydrase-like pyridoxal-dependent ACC family enzyme